MECYVTVEQKLEDVEKAKTVCHTELVFSFIFSVIPSLLEFIQPCCSLPTSE